MAKTTYLTPQGEFKEINNNSLVESLQATTQLLQQQRQVNSIADMNKTQSDINKQIAKRYMKELEWNQKSVDIGEHDIEIDNFLTSIGVSYDEYLWLYNFAVANGFVDKLKYGKIVFRGDRRTKDVRQN